MCGIVGYIAKEKLPIVSIAEALAHRGPDAKGEYSTQLNGQYIGLGHTRLSIIDITEKGNQPFSSQGKGIHLIYNGEVYNFQDLKHRYLKGHTFLSDTDTEVILKLYEKMGIGFVEYLNGDFSICILDETKGKLYLIRDRAGVKPLYYTTKENKFVFASEIKAILDAGIEPKLAKDHLQRFFVFKYSPGVETLFDGVYRMPPGHFGEYDLGASSFEIKQYWNPDRREEYSAMNYKESKDTLRNLLKDSVEKRLVADVPIGTFLSGGLDSSIIAYFLKENSEVAHYCASKEKRDLKKEGTTSDFYYAKKLANEWNLNISEIQIGGEQLNLEQLRNMLIYGDDLIADGSMVPSYLITRKAAKRSKVILSGMGADELFYGYAGHQMTLLDHYLGKMPFSKQLAKLLFSLDQGNGKFKAFRRYLHKLGKYYNYPKYKYGIYTIVGDFENSMSIYREGSENTISMLSNYFSQDTNPFSSFNKFEYDNFLQKNVSYLDRMTMANSVEGRVPFLDHRIIEFAYSIPRNYKLNFLGKTKRIIKDAFEEELPSYVIKRRKAGFGMPLRSIFSDEEKIKELMDMDLFVSLEGFSSESIQNVTENHLSGREDNSSIIYALLSFQEWYKMYINK